MKILLISTQDYIHHPVPSRHHYLFENLAHRHEVHVAHFHVSRGEARSTRLKIKETTLFPFKNPLIHYTLNTPYHFYIFNKIVKEENYDVIVAAHVLAGTAAIHAAKKCGIPVVFDLKDWFPDSAAAYFKNPFLESVVRRGVWEITKYNLSNSDKITTVSPSLVKKLSQLGYTSDLITNGVDTEIFKPRDGTAARKELGIAPEDFVIGFSGSIERWYAIDDMIRILPTLLDYRQDTKLLIVGGSLFTDYQETLASLVHELRLSDHVIFTGPKPYSELPKFISCMDVCTIPLSPPQWGNIALPNKFFEYSACGKPIVMRPMPDVEKTGSQNLFVYKTQAEYVALIKQLMQSPVTYSIDLEKNSWKEKARQLETILQNVT